MVMTGSTKIIVIAVVAVVAIAGIAGGAFYFMNKDKNNEKELVIATSPDFPNYEYMYGEEYAGIDLDIIRAICDELGYKPKFQNVTFGGIIGGVKEGKYDVPNKRFAKVRTPCSQ